MSEIWRVTFPNGMALFYDDEEERASGGLWLANAAGEGVRIEPTDVGLGEVLLDYFDGEF